MAHTRSFVRLTLKPMINYGRDIDGAYTIAMEMANTETKKNRVNPWWEFVKQNKSMVSHLPTRKEQFESLSNMWREQKNTIVSVPLEYIMKLREESARLKEHVQELERENERITERVGYLEDMLS